MADHPGKAFAFTDLFRALKLSPATCHALLSGLVDVGYIYRATDKTYVLGPALAALGRVANKHFSPLQIAKPEMRRLADIFGVACSAIFQAGDFVVCRERAASASHVGYALPLGALIPLRPHFIAIFYAWSPAEAQAILDKTEPSLTDDQRVMIESNIAFVRKHGFNVLLHCPTFRSAEWLADCIPDDDNNLLAMLLNRLVAEDSYELSSIAAPVFDARGNVDFVMSLIGFNRAITGVEIAAAGESLKQACARIGDFHSRSPQLVRL